MVDQETPVLERLVRSRLVPVVVLDDAADADPLAEALVGGGLPVAEVTFRTVGGRGVDPGHGRPRRRARRRRHGAHAQRRWTARWPPGQGSSSRPGSAGPWSSGARSTACRCCRVRSRPRRCMAALELGLHDREVLPGRHLRGRRRRSPRSRPRSAACGSSPPAASGRGTCTSTWRCRPWPPSAAPGWCRGDLVAAGDFDRDHAASSPRPSALAAEWPDGGPER